MGQVFGVEFGLDSSTLLIPGAEVVISRIDSIPPDTVPVDSLPSDSLLWNGLVLRPAVLDSGTVDSIPNDTTPPDSFTTGTMPPDSNPPPPAPGCGRTGAVVAHLQSGGDSRFHLGGLAPAT
jgi:hypothetical protein